MLTVSFSRLEIFEKCPFQVYLKYVEKRPEATDPKRQAALDRGKQTHEAAEHYVKGETETLPKELSHLVTELDEAREAFRNGQVSVEENWGFRLDWTQTGWFDTDVWLRMALDRVDWLDAERTAARVVDYKTGRKDGNEVKHNQQGQLYMLGTFARFPALQAIEVRFDYLDHKQKTTKRYTREQGMVFMPRMDARLKALSEATVFPAKPNRINCKWCPYGVNRGDGSCEFGVEA